MQKKTSTIHDIARHLSISASTVSRALNNHPRISKTTKELVLNAVKELNYKPNSLASNLRRGKGNTIGVILPVINRHFFANIIHGIEKIATPAGFQIIICQSDESLQKEIDSIHTLIRNRVSGILISISSETKDASHFQSAIKSNIPIVMFDRVLKNIDVAKIRNDDFAGAYNTTIHLIEQGYRTIVHFSGPLNIPTYLDRFEGYRKALTDRSIPYRKELVIENTISRVKGSEAMNNLLNLEMKFDAVFAASDMSALGALLVLKERGISVPETIGIAGYVNEPFAEFIEPSLTSTEQFGENMGQEAARLIIDKLNSGTDISGQILQIIPKLIIRNSSIKNYKKP
jgi:LacI family transcriptional regulator